MYCIGIPDRPLANSQIHIVISQENGVGSTHIRYRWHLGSGPQMMRRRGLPDQPHYG